MARKKIDERVRQEVLAAREAGLSLKKIAEQFGISTTSVSRIIKASEPGRTTIQKTDRQRKIEAIEKRIAELERQIRELDAKHSR